MAIESEARGFAPEVVREYLTRYIVHELGPRDYQGMELFLDYASPGDGDGNEVCHGSLTGVRRFPILEERRCIYCC